MANDYKRNKSKRKKYLDENKEVVAERKRRYYLKTSFGISVEEYERMHDQQNGLCAVCRNPETAIDNKNSQQVRRLAVDHDHGTGKIRGLLCQKCNMGIGYFQDDPALLREAANYLSA